MSRWAQSHPDDYDALIDAYREEADTRRKESREGSGRGTEASRPLSAQPRVCPLCGGTDHTIEGANRVTSIGIDWGARFHCSNCGANYR